MSEINLEKVVPFEYESDPTSYVAYCMQKLEIPEIIVRFDCGGDEMGDVYLEEFLDYGDINLFGKWESEGEKTEKSLLAEALVNVIEEFMYSRVSFYVASDGHYQGENGTVDITLHDYEEGEDRVSVSKFATQEFEEEIYTTKSVEFTEEEANYIKNCVHSVEQDGWTSNPLVRKDGVDESEYSDEMEKQIVLKIDNIWNEMDFGTTDEFKELRSEYHEIEGQSAPLFRLPVDGEQIEFKNNCIDVQFGDRYYAYHEYDE